MTPDYRPVGFLRWLFNPAAHRTRQRVMMRLDMIRRGYL